MKSLILSMAFISTSFFGGFANNDDVSVKKADYINDEALRCKVTVSDGENSVTSTCWFCDCEENQISAVLTLESISE